MNAVALPKTAGDGEIDLLVGDGEYDTGLLLWLPLEVISLKNLSSSISRLDSLSDKALLSASLLSVSLWSSFWRRIFSSFKAKHTQHLSLIHI